MGEGVRMGGEVDGGVRTLQGRGLVLQRREERLSK